MKVELTTECPTCEGSGKITKSDYCANYYVSGTDCCGACVQGSECLTCEGTGAVFSEEAMPFIAAFDKKVGEMMVKPKHPLQPTRITHIIHDDYFFSARSVKNRNVHFTAKCSVKNDGSVWMGEVEILITEEVIEKLGI